MMERWCCAPGGAACGPRAGAFIPFANPDDTALEADVFWRVQDYARVLFAHVRSDDLYGVGGKVSLHQVRCRKVLLKRGKGEQHLLLRDHGRVAQVRCLGEDIGNEPFVLEVVAGDFPDIEKHQRLLKRFADLFRNRPDTRRKAGWSVGAMRHRDALAALDRRMEGRSYREIAIFLHGERLVQEDWNKPDQSLKNRVIRSVKRGFGLMNGGYRKLLS